MIRKLLVAVFAALPVAASAACEGVDLFATRLLLSPHGSGALHLHFDNLVQGYAPRFGPPVVSMSGSTITITQPMTDIADFTQPGSAPTSQICSEGDVDLGVLGAGTWYLQMLNPLTVDGVGRGAVAGGGGVFILGPEGEVQCTSTRSFTMLMPPASGLPLPTATVAISSNVVVRGSYFDTVITRDGNTFIVTDNVSTEFPAEYKPYCLRSTVGLGQLAPGVYSVEWRIDDFGIRRPDGRGRFSFTVVSTPAPPPRRRATSH